MNRYSAIAESDLYDLLETLHDRYNVPDFIEDDPVSIPHRYSSREDIEISGFLSATIAWGNRKMIVRNARQMMKYMDDSPFDYVTSASDAELGCLASFVHRTFNGDDFINFVLALRKLYHDFGNLGAFFEKEYASTKDIRQVLSLFRKRFFSAEHTPHCEKHLSSIDKGSACKRLNMFLRWMVRRDDRGVDFGLWRKIPMAALYLPLDVHSGNVARELGLLNRKQNDWKAVEEVTTNLQRFNADDPIRYDFSLFGAGVNSRF